MEITKRSTIFQTHSTRLALYNLKPNNSRTHYNNFLILSPEPSPRMFQSSILRVRKLSVASYLSALGYKESQGTQTVCSDIP